MKTFTIDGLSPVIRQSLENLHDVVPRHSIGLTEIVWIFLKTDDLAALMLDPPSMRRRYPADRYSVTVLAPSAEIVARAAPNAINFLGDFRVFEVADDRLMRYCNEYFGGLAEINLGERSFVFWESRLFVGEKVLLQFDEEARVDYEMKDELNYEMIARGIVHPLEMSETGVAEHRQYGGVTDASLNFVELSATRRTPGRLQRSESPEWYVGAKPGLNPSTIEYIDDDVVFIGPLSKHYGHFILEGLARLWFFLADANRKYKAVYMSEPGVDRFNDVFAIFGIASENLFRISKPTAFRSVIVPEQSMRIQDRVHRKYKETVDRIMHDIPPAGHRKVYFSKEARGNFRGMGEKPLEQIFAANGYQIFYPERLSMFETLSVLKGADRFAASSGTNAHNAIFLRDGAMSICLNRSPHVHYIQTMIDRLRGLDAWYVEANVSILPADWSVGPFLFGPTRHLINFLNYQGFSFDATKFIDEFPVYLIDFLKIWGIYYNDALRKTYIEDEEKTIAFDDLIKVVVDTFSHMAPQLKR
jgi:hypothetical protein